LANNLEFIC